MQIIPFLQHNKWRSRRKIVSLIQDKKLFLNNQDIESFKTELEVWDILSIVNEEWEKETINVTENDNIQQWKIIMFNKPKWYVVSKSDPHNNTIYELLPEEFKDRYYIWRLDKDSRWLVVLTDTPALVHQIEHPKFEIDKEYLVQLTSQFKDDDKQRAKSWIMDEWELLKFKDIVPTRDALVYSVVLKEWKKRHIRRVIKHLWYNLIDLQRIKEAQRSLPTDLKEGEWRYVK